MSERKRQRIRIRTRVRLRRTRLQRARPVVLALGVLGFVASLLVSALILATSGYAPREWGRFFERRALGSPSLVATPLNTLAGWLDRRDRMPRVAATPLPAWAGIGAGATTSAPPQGIVQAVNSVETLRAVLAQANPGDTILLQGGRYIVSERPIELNRAGTAQAPIRLVGGSLGAVSIEVETKIGLIVTAPFWVIENLLIRGICSEDELCDHAIRIEGAAASIVIRNNRLEDFNAQIVAGGQRGAAAAVFPDGGLIEGNTLRNSRPREGTRAVVPIEVAAANGWVIRRNIIADFVRARGDQVSFGAILRGAAVGSRIESNLIVCEHRLLGLQGSRVGISFGGNGSVSESCRDRRCLVEHERGIAMNNVIVGCSDSGIHLNRASQTRLEHNTLIDTAGIVAYFGESTVFSLGNLVDGELNDRQGGFIAETDDSASTALGAFFGRHPVRDAFVAPGALDFRWREAPPARTKPGTQSLDLCGQKRPVLARYGAFESIDACFGLKPAVVAVH